MGETKDELAGGIFVLRNKAKKVSCDPNTIDTCGTGGDGQNSLNISTAAAIVLASKAFTRDLPSFGKVLVIDKTFKVQELVKIISEIDNSLIRDVKVFDLYEGENIPSDKKSIALNVTIQSLQKSLNDKDLEKINNLIISTVESKTGAKIRS